MDLTDLLGGLDADDAKKLLRLAKGLPDDALGMLSELPDVLKKLGDGLAQAGELLAGVASDFTGIGIPTVEPTYAKVAGFNVVSGMDIGSRLSDSGGSVRSLIS
ncbi:MAG: hypothetical protein ACRDTM_08030 [Micromonosporaceae bacterium]